ncbi:TrkA C-terminal domain-containing protein [Paenibacillus sp. FSL W8-0186]|uniref:GntR family transcriptional regulator n=1 Tax=Paenibacillus woosongensis TaxID=307580 RepID=A0ABQ4MK70_9BACL|nr:TrkA C-terminal domain-containing protein [Paenibacillus woosongensis]GIP56392.1 GntR family transcriptional regulator [Paenibacillus woosongensis]
MQEIAVYKSIALDIAQRIVSGELAVHSKISGRSLLAAQYHVSPETIRKAIGLLKDEGIVSVSQGKEIVVISDQKAGEYLASSNYLKSAYSLKRDLEQLMAEKKEVDRRFEVLLNKITKASDRLQNLTPYNPMEIQIKEGSHAVGKTIGNLLFWQNTGATVIALRRGTRISISPGPHVILRENDMLVFVGDPKIYDKTERFVNQTSE